MYSCTNSLTTNQSMIACRLAAWLFWQRSCKAIWRIRRPFLCLAVIHVICLNLHAFIKDKLYSRPRLFKRWIVLSVQRKVVSDRQGLVDFAIGLVIFVLNLPDEQKKKSQKDCNQSCSLKRVWGLVEMTYGLVHASYSLPEWQAVKLTFLFFLSDG